MNSLIAKNIRYVATKAFKSGLVNMNKANYMVV